MSASARSHLSNQISFLAELSRELRASIHAGAALAALTIAAGCGGDASSATVVASAGTGNVAAPGTDDIDAPVAVDPEPVNTDHVEPPPHPSAPPLEPLAPERLGCFGPTHDDGYYGQCCFAARCYAPPAGEACASADRISAGSFIPLPRGSGDCGCSVPEEGRPYVSGPFAPNVTSATAGSPDSCCYLVGSISCTGRPLVVDGTQLVAAAVQRSDWLVA